MLHHGAAVPLAVSCLRRGALHGHVSYGQQLCVATVKLPSWCTTRTILQLDTVVVIEDKHSPPQCSQGQHDAINDSRRVVAHHLEVLRPCLHEFVRAAVPALDQLRSVTVKNAIALMQVWILL